MSSAETTGKLPRQYDLDWLRVFVILFVFLFHVGLVFSVDNLGVHSDWRNQQLAQFLFYTSFLRMPVLFFVAGAGTWFLFRRRSVRQFIAERGQRLLVPFIVALVLIVPAMHYIGYRFQAERSGASVPGYGDVFSRVISAVPYEFMHLWFIAYLLIFSVLTVPLFRFLRTARGQSALDRLLSVLNWRGGVFLFAIPLVLIEWSMQWSWSGEVPLVNDWAYFTLYLYLFICGFVLVSDSRFWAGVHRALPVAIIATAGLFVTLPVLRLRIDTTQAFLTDWDYTLFHIGMGTMGWVSMLAVLGLARRYLSFENRLLRYARDASYPFYLLHMLPLWAVAYVVVSFSLPVGAELVIITIASFALTLAMYEMFVCRLRFTRFAFGLKPAADGTESPAGKRNVVVPATGKQGSS